MKDISIEEIYRSFERRLRGYDLRFFRYLYSGIDWNERLIGIKGPKGCGKTTILMQRILKDFPERDKALYISLDDLWFSANSPMDAVERHCQWGGTHVLMDEVHYYPKWQQLLKNIYDQYPELHIVYTGSSMLQIDSAKGDLSRRQTLYSLQGLSFREFLEFEGITGIPVVRLEDLLCSHEEIAREITSRIRIMPYFHAYLQHGYYPFYRESQYNYHLRLKEVANTVIEVDYPLVDEIYVSTIRKTKKMLMILAARVPQTPKMSELYHQLETDRNQGLKMLGALKRGGLLSLLSSKNRSYKELGRPDKIYLDNTNLMYALSPEINTGTMRETFFFNQLKQAHTVTYPAAGDFLIDNRATFEIGGRGKDFTQIRSIQDSYLAVDEVEIGHRNRIPLWMFGLLY